MPVRDGLSATEELLRTHPDLKIIVLTTFDTDDMVLRALRTGAAGFLLKDTKPARLVEAIRTVAAGQPMLSPSVTAQLIAAVTRDDPGAAAQDRTRRARAALAGLTERERDVADGVGPRPEQRRDRGRALHGRADGEDARRADLRQAGRREPGAGRDPGPRRPGLGVGRAAQRTSSRSTTKISVSPGLMAPPAPRSP